MYNKRTKTVMESIKVVIDDTISEKDIDDDGEGPNLKKNEGDDNIILRWGCWERITRKGVYTSHIKKGD